MSDQMSLTAEDVDAALAEGEAEQAAAETNERATLAKREPTALSERGADLRDTKQLMEMARLLYDQGLAPASYRTPAQIMLGMLRVRELGLDGVGGIQNTYMVNNRVAVYGDAAMALVYRSGQLADIKEFRFDDEARGRVAVCEVTRYNSQGGSMQPFRVEFSEADARKAGLGNKGPWKSYLDIMLLWRARHFAMRSRFPDLLMGCDWAHAIAGTVDVIGGPPNESGNDRLGEALKENEE